MGQNSRERRKAKQKADKKRRPTTDSFGAPSVQARQRLAEEIIAAAVEARHRGHAAELKRCRALLAEGPGGEMGAQIVNRALFTMLDYVTMRLWERGWQPSEVVRMARRDHTARHGRLMTDIVAAQMRVYAVATLDPRWQSQLTAMDARVWWEHDDRYMDVWGVKEGLDRAASIDHALDLLHLSQTLPPVERVGPAPGSAQPAGAVPTSDVDRRMLDRVRALLAKAESTDFPEEAETYTAKAQQLMARHSIDQAVLAARSGGRDEPEIRRVGIDNPYEAPKSLLLQIVAEANGCRAVWSKRFAFTTIVGFPADLDSVELLFTSLLVQATRAMTQANPQQDRYGRNTTRSFRQAFLTAYADRIGERLDTAFQEVGREMADADGGENLLPVLAARSDAVREAFEREFPEVTSHTTQIRSREGWIAGRAAADLASMHGRTGVTG